MRTIRLFLIIAGCTALFAGVAIAAIAASPLLTARTPVVPTHTAVYVGPKSCFTCHEGQPSSWAAAHPPRLMPVAVLNPRVTPVDLQTLDYTDESSPMMGVPLLDDMENIQQYMLHTTNGDLVLPGHWKVGDRWYFVSPNAESPCIECHDDNLQAADSQTAPNAAAFTTETFTTAFDQTVWILKRIAYPRFSFVEEQPL